MEEVLEVQWSHGCPVVSWVGGLSRVFPLYATTSTFTVETRQQWKDWFELHLLLLRFCIKKRYIWWLFNFYFILESIMGLAWLCDILL